MPSSTTSKLGLRRSGRGSKCRARACTRTSRRGVPTSASAPGLVRSRSSCTRSTPRAWRCRARSPRCLRPASSPMAPSRCRPPLSPIWVATTCRRLVPRNDSLRRAGPPAVVGLAVLLGAFSLGDAWVVAQHLREDAQRTSRLFARVFAGLSDPRSDAAVDALFDLAEQVRAFKIPIALSATAGTAAAVDNMPPGAGGGVADTARWIARLDAINRPILQPGVGTIHYGALPIARRLAVLALLQGAVLFGLAALALWAFRWRLAAARDRLWVAMAREAAHQLGTPLMSLTGWIAYLRENPAIPAAELADHLQADAERLERVAKRFERIGRPARQEPVGLGTVAERVVTYFQPRLPTLASPIALTVHATGPGPAVQGDPVLLESALG